ncbi:hypothetical protein PBRA_004595 [Plasmodiophora brassicae]|uniref:Anticodon-binding domain-containing protein n=1 Tax=Plasmodiophora brassicae TaxID=37360 RepID=A0A0G4ILB0_PLABS|nr:hypothetical protein PBRA_004595 [Plasmodiophora brassicae]
MRGGRRGGHGRPDGGKRPANGGPSDRRDRGPGRGGAPSSPGGRDRPPSRAKNGATVQIVILGTKQRQYADQVADEVRSAGFWVETRYLEGYPLREVINQAEDEGSVYMFIVGVDNERDRDVSFKILAPSQPPIARLPLKRVIEEMVAHDRTVCNAKTPVSSSWSPVPVSVQSPTISPSSCVSAAVIEATSFPAKNYRERDAPPHRSDDYRDREMPSRSSDYRDRDYPSRPSDYRDRAMPPRVSEYRDLPRSSDYGGARQASYRSHGPPPPSMQPYDDVPRRYEARAKPVSPPRGAQGYARGYDRNYERRDVEPAAYSRPPIPSPPALDRPYRARAPGFDSRRGLSPQRVSAPPRHMGAPSSSIDVAAVSDLLRTLDDIDGQPAPAPTYGRAFDPNFAPPARRYDVPPAQAYHR